MKFVGIDLHKQSITVCVVDQSANVLRRRRFVCADEDGIRRFFETLVPFRCVVEATGGYEWIARLLEPLTDRFVLAHPRKLRIIAESTRKSDRLDARILAEELAAGRIPEAHRPTPRQRDHRRLVRRRHNVQRRISALKCRVRRVLADHNLDVPWLFTLRGRDHLETLAIDPAARFVVDETMLELDFQTLRLRAAERRLQTFAEEGTVGERERRAILRTIPGVGFVTSEIVLAELADVDRFRSQKQATSYAGLVPGSRESAGKRRDLGIEKAGSTLLRWALVEAARRLVRHSPRWRHEYERLKDRIRARKAIVAIARRLLCLMVAMLKSGKPYDPTHTPPKHDTPTTAAAC